jgi:hypothetical protein
MISNSISHKLIVPESIHVVEHVKWINAARVQNLNDQMNLSKLLQLDFAGVKRLEPYHIAPLACIVHEYIARGYNVEFGNENEIIQNYLESFNFKQFCEKEERHNEFPTTKNPETFPLWRIEASASNTYPKYVQQYYESNSFEGKDLFELGNLLGELMNNVFDHSECPIPGYTFTQADLRMGQLITSVCDFGIGIPQKVNNYLKSINQPELLPTDALIKATEYEFSTKSQPRNRGFGLDTIIKNVSSLNGRIRIISGEAIYLGLPNGGIKTLQMDVNFPGCLIVIYLNTENLRIKENELSEEMHLID